MTENNDTPDTSTDTTADPLLAQIAEFIGDANAKEAAEREAQNVRSKESMGAALKTLMATYNRLHGDDREGFATALARLANKAQGDHDSAAFMADAASGNGTLNPEVRSQTDPRSAEHQLREPIALLNSIRTTRPNEFGDAVRFVKRVINETFGPNALDGGFSEYQLVFNNTGSGCTLGVLRSAFELNLILGEALKQAEALAKKAGPLVERKLMARSDGEEWQLGDQVFHDDDIDAVGQLIEEITKLKRQAQTVPTPTTRTAGALGAGNN